MLKWITATALSLTLATNVGAVAQADGLSAGVSAFRRGDYVNAARLLSASARRDNAKAQALLGHMYANGLGVPQSYPAAIALLNRSAHRGNATAQHLLGLMYDKGLGTSHDDVMAYLWLNLAAARAGGRERDYYLRLRNAVASKMTSAQVAEGQRLAVEWAPSSRF